MQDKLFVIINRFLNKQAISYLVFGVLTTFIDTITFYIGNKVFNIEYIISTVIAWVLAVMFAYITNKLWVFNSKSKKIDVVLKEVISFFIARLVSLGFTVVWMIFAVQMLHTDEVISKLLANVFVVIMNYWFSKIFIFKMRDHR